MWIKDDRCERVVSEAWGDGLCMAYDYPVLSCKEECRSKLEVWNQTEYAHMGKKIAQLQKRLEFLEVQPTSPRGGVRGGREGALAPPNPAQNFPFLCLKILYSYLILLY